MTLSQMLQRLGRRRAKSAQAPSGPGNADMEANFKALSGCFDDEYAVRHLYDVAGFYGKNKPPQG